MFLLGLIVSLCFIPGWTAAGIPTQWAVCSIALPSTLWWQGPFTIIHKAWLWFVTWAALSLFFTPNIYGGVFDLWQVCLWVLCIWLGTTLTSLRSLWFGLALGVSVSSALAIPQWFGFDWFPIFGTYPAGLFYNSVVLGAVCALLGIALLIEGEWTAVLCLMPGLVLSMSRGAWLAFLIGLLALSRKWSLIAILIAGCAALIWFLPRSESDQTRLFIWSIAWARLDPYGNGVGSFSALHAIFNGTALYPEHVHNDTLELIFNYGIFAAIPLGTFAFCLTQWRCREWPILVTFLSLGLWSFPLWIPLTSFIGLVVTGHMLRGWALDGGLSNLWGFDLLSWLSAWQSAADESRGEAIPVVTNSQES